MEKRLFVVLIVFVSVMSLGSQLVFGQQNNTVGTSGKTENMLDANYTVNLIIETPKIKKNISFVVANKDFSFGQYFQDAFINFDGNLKIKGNNILLLGYQLGLKEKVAGEDISKTSENEWIENGCEGSLILEANKQISFFKTADRLYTINISKFTDKE